LRKGEPWGGAAAGPADLEVAGSDADLARALVGDGELVRFRPSPGSDLARVVGLEDSEPVGGLALPMDALRLSGGRMAVNAVVVGVPPDQLRSWHRRHPLEVEVDGRPIGPGKATSVVVLNGQYLRGADLAPRGHPGDGTCEVQVYALAPGQRRLMRVRLGRGVHLPHPAITTARGRRVSVRSPHPLPLEIDGLPADPAREIGVELLPGAYRLLV
jgi:putative lipid kinase YegS-like protein